MNSHIQQLQTITSTADGDKAVAVGAAKYSKENPGWFDSVSGEQMAAAVTVVDRATEFKSKSYDEVTAVSCILLAFFATLMDIPEEILFDLGLMVEGERLSVMNNEKSNLKFWKHYDLVLSGNQEKIVRDKTVRMILKHPKLIKKQSIMIFTDPGTDSNSDDEKACAYIEIMRKFLGLWETANYIITAKYEGLSDRAERLEPILQSVNGEEANYTITAYDPRQNETRFFAPYSADIVSTKFKPLSYENCCGSFLHKVDTVLLIGQFGSGFSEKMEADCRKVRNRIRCMVVQGPGFNTLGIDFEKLKTFAPVFSYTDRDGAAFVNKAIHDMTMGHMKKFSPKITDYRDQSIFRFVITDEKTCFQNQFKGFHFKEHFGQILDAIC